MFTFLFGAIVGGIACYYFLQQQAKETSEIGPSSPKELAAAQSEIRELKSEVTRYQQQEKQLKDYQVQLQAKMEELQRATKEISEAQTQLQTLREHVATAETKAQPVVAMPVEEPPKEETPPVRAVAEPPAKKSSPKKATHAEPDNLRKVQGIGPKVAQILNEAGIQTFAQLAQTDVDRLKAILEEAGPSFKWMNPESWPKQAGFAAKGDSESLKKFQAELSGN